MAKPKYFKGRTVLGGKTLKWESVFPMGTRHDCRRCALCCGGRVDLTDRDVRAMGSKGLSDSVFFPPSGSARPFLRMSPGGYCSNLDEKGLCGIYRDRPMICRSYPMLVTPDFEDNLVIDLVLKCPYINLESQPEIKKSDIEKSIRLHKGHMEDEMMRSLAYRGTLAKHVWAAYPAAFLPRKQKLGLMDRCIDLLRGVEDSPDLIRMLRDWSDKVAATGHRVIVRDRGGVFGRGTADEVLSKMPGVDAQRGYELDKARWRNVFSDIGNTLFYLREGELRRAPIRLGWRVKVGGRSYGWGRFKGLAYSDDAMEELIGYMKLLVRRSSFQRTVALLAEYLIDFKRMVVVDPSLECMILSNGMGVYLDPICRVMAAVREHDRIEGEDVKAAASNMDGQFLNSLADGTIAAELRWKMDSVFRS